MNHELNKQVAVYCASSTQIDDSYFRDARHLGQLMAEQNVTLINGAGNMGLMAESADGCLQKGGKAIGVIPTFMIEEGWCHNGKQKTDYEKLVIEITTDGSIHPKDALKGAAEILIQHFQLFTDREIVLDNTENNANEEFDEEVLKMRQLLKTKLVDMDLSVRALNCLKSAEVETLGELVVFNKTDLLKFRNFGKKSLSELEELLATLNLHFGMDITKYKLEKE